MKRNLILIIIILMSFAAIYPCTIGVASHSITASNKQLLWKSRDISPSTTNIVRYVENMTHKFVAVTTSGDNLAWMGVNEMGFALANSLSDDLTVDTGSFNNGNLIYNSLGLVADLAGFEDYLDILTSPNSLDLELRGNFVAFDAQGNSRLYEVNNDNYWVFDNADTNDSYLLRTNHSVNGGGTNGIERFVRTSEIISGLVENDELSVNNLLTQQIRDISDQQSQPYTLPWQFGDATPLYSTEYSIARRNTISAVVIEGVEAGQDPKLTTMWLIMGNPFVSYAIPLLPTVKPTLETINNLSQNSPELVNILWNADNDYLLDTSLFVNSNDFSLLQTFRSKEIESYQTMENLKIQWANEDISATEIKEYINDQANTALEFSTELFTQFTPNENSDVEALSDLKMYPNPFSSNITIEVNSAKSDSAVVKIYNIKGQLVKTFDSSTNSKYIWNGKNNKNDKVPNGIYLIKYDSKNESITKKVVLLRGN